MYAFEALTTQQKKDLAEIVAQLLVPGKGILVLDETVSTLNKRFFNLGIENTEESRRRYRQIFATADDEIQNYIAGVILSHETFYQQCDDGQPFPDVFKAKNALVGIRLDRGVVALPGTNDETTTQGLDGLDERCAQYKIDGADFAKFRCVLRIAEDAPSPLAVWENSNVLGRYASICQQNGLVPLIVPEIICEGNHDLKKSQFVTETVLASVFKSLHDHHIFLEGIVLQPNMVMPGHKCTLKYSPDEVAKATIIALRNSVPPAIPGISFMSGGQSEHDSIMLLNVVSKCPLPKSWILTFSYGRPLQTAAAAVWGGRESGVKMAQQEYLKHAKAAAQASVGMYRPTSSEKESPTTESVFISLFISKSPKLKRESRACYLSASQ